MTHIPTETFAIVSRNSNYHSTENDGTCVITMQDNMPKALIECENDIRQEVANILVMFAKGVVEEYGFEHILGWNISVFTMDGHLEDEKDRSYAVDFKNSKGARITLVGIYMVEENLDSFIHHGFDISSR